MGVSRSSLRCQKRSQGPVLPEALAAEAFSSDIELPVGYRIYCVWEVPRHPHLIGIHTGPGPLAYHRILGLRGEGSKFPFKSVAWQRVTTLKEALEVFKTRGPETIEIPKDIQLFTWTLCALALAGVQPADQKYTLVVRPSEAYLREAGEEINSVVVQGKDREVALIGVTGKPAQLSAKPLPGCRLARLGLDTQDVLRAYFRELSSAESFVQASDSESMPTDPKDREIERLKAALAAAKRKTTRFKMRTMDEADSGDSEDSDLEEEMIADDMLTEHQRLLEKVRLGKASASSSSLLQRATEGGMTSGSASSARNATDKGKPRKGQLALLEKPVKEKRTLKDIISEKLEDPAILAGLEAKDLIQLQLMREVQPKSRAKAQGDDTDDELEAELKGIGKSIRNYNDRKKDLMQNPLRYVRGFVEEAREEMGVDEEQYFNMVDLHKTVAFGWQKGLHRCYVMLLEILKLQLQEKQEEATALNTQCLRAIKQAVLDGGKWRTAWHLTYLADPLSKKRFGGTPQELEVIAQFEKSLDDIERRTKAMDEEENTEADAKKAWWKKKQWQGGGGAPKEEAKTDP